jgi:hypothetical protein
VACPTIRPKEAHCFVTALRSRKLLSCDWAATSLSGATYEHEVDGCYLSNLCHAHICTGSAERSSAEGAENVVEIVSSDKHKLQTYCKFAELSDQIGEANEDGDTKKAQELSQKINELGTKLGAEFVALADTPKNTDPNSQVGPEIGLIFNKLDALCED